MISVPLFETPDHRRHVLRFPAAPVTIIEVPVPRKRARCIHGHALTPENTYRSPAGKVNCRACTRLAVRRSRARGR